MNTTDPALKELYDAFAKCTSNKSRVKFLEDHKESGIYKDYDIKWDKLIFVWKQKNPQSYFTSKIQMENDEENKKGTKDTLDN
tara:strand:- start:395 stop:643 length:249 start_codon:yes stop_codon:yes gene_type:complete